MCSSRPCSAANFRFALLPFSILWTEQVQEPCIVARDILGDSHGSGIMMLRPHPTHHLVLFKALERVLVHYPKVKLRTDLRPR